MLAGIPIQRTEYPAITICNKGWINKVLARALLKQYQDYAGSKGVQNYSNLKFGDNPDLERIWLTNVYPGVDSDPLSVIKMKARSGQ